MYDLATIIFTLFYLCPSAAASTPCYNFGADKPLDAWYASCAGDSDAPSMCCRINDQNASNDTCATEPAYKGLCHSAGGQLWRESCTDQSWESESCVKLCWGQDPVLLTNGTTTYTNQSNGDYLITICPQDGSLCCGAAGSDAVTQCCTEEKGVWLDNYKIVTTKPVFSTPALATATSTVPQESTSSLAKDSHGVSVGAVAGGVVGGVVALAFGAGGLWLLFRRRKENRKAEDDVKPTQTHGLSQKHELYTEERKPFEMEAWPLAELVGEGGTESSISSMPRDPIELPGHNVDETSPER
ncbi:hypothetical protein BDV96DRAFT_600957 [Lophiotrema nucula]|uniref:Mid2 domain-containing protein n=1 Tax=Lophiotrema nucula TaxID=690887 RepID=A0A6A5Z493_9PLEO|nr:hypothetical protein BDV96DRAFT_600957 [Lophiotrema nucula]